MNLLHSGAKLTGAFVASAFLIAHLDQMLVQSLPGQL